MATKNSSLKTLKITPSLHKELSALGGKGDTFDIIIRRLIAFKQLSSKEESIKVESRIKSKYEGKI